MPFPFTGKARTRHELSFPPVCHLRRGRRGLGGFTQQVGAQVFGARLIEEAAEGGHAVGLLGALQHDRVETHRLEDRRRPGQHRQVATGVVAGDAELRRQRLGCDAVLAGEKLPDLGS